MWHGEENMEFLPSKSTDMTQWEDKKMLHLLAFWLGY